MDSKLIKIFFLFYLFLNVGYVTCGNDSLGIAIIGSESSSNVFLYCLVIIGVVVALIIGWLISDKS